MRKQFKDTVMDLARQDEGIVLIFGDVSVYLFHEFQAKYPQRFYNMGICENTLISVGAGLSAQGFRPFIHTIAPFITERSYEQIKLDLCYNCFPANIVSCGASFDYAWDGATHHCYTDLAILRLLPEMEVLQPGSRKELDILLRSCYSNERTTYFRLSDHPHDIDMAVEFGKGVILMNRCARVTVITAGPILKEVMGAVSDLEVNLVYFHTLKPMDHQLVQRFKDTRILVIHDAFGLREALTEQINLNLEYHGLNDCFYGWYGKLSEIRAKCGLDAQSIRHFVQSRL
jgi:transketolase